MKKAPGRVGAGLKGFLRRWVGVAGDNLEEWLDVIDGGGILMEGRGISAAFVRQVLRMAQGGAEEGGVAGLLLQAPWCWLQDGRCATSQGVSVDSH